MGGRYIGPRLPAGNQKKKAHQAATLLGGLLNGDVGGSLAGWYHQLIKDRNVLSCAVNMHMLEVWLKRHSGFIQQAFAGGPFFVNQGSLPGRSLRRG